MALFILRLICHEVHTYMYLLVGGCKHGERERGRGEMRAGRENRGEERRGE